MNSADDVLPRPQHVNRSSESYGWRGQSVKFYGRFVSLFVYTIYPISLLLHLAFKKADIIAIADLLLFIPLLITVADTLMVFYFNFYRKEAVAYKGPQAFGLGTEVTVRGRKAVIGGIIDIIAFWSLTIIILILLKYPSIILSPLQQIGVSTRIPHLV
jgi:hypothetical protein